MPAKLSTHVLDTFHGRPAAGVAISLWRRDGDGWAQLAAVATNADGRTGALLADAGLAAGTYELRFGVGAYFAACGVASPFLDEVPVRFAIADASASYHVPLVMTPWSYSTYRGS